MIDQVVDKDVFIKHPILADIGNHVAIDKGFFCTTRLHIGDYTHIGPYVTCIGGQDSALILNGFNNISAGVRIICGSDAFDDEGLAGAMIPKELKCTQKISTIVIEEFATISTNSIIFPGSVVSMGSIIGAGCVFSGISRPWTVYVGNPAKVLRVINKTKLIEAARKLGYVGQI